MFVSPGLNELIHCITGPPYIEFRLVLVINISAQRVDNSEIILKGFIVMTSPSKPIFSQLELHELRTSS